MLVVQAPAKLNLFLHVLGERPDGYHELETLFERIDLADELTFEPADASLSLTCDDPTLSVGEENLVLQAARLLQHTCRVPRGARIHLRKRIPIAAGLGGGSSDAASTLLALNALWRLELPMAELLRLGATLGSDVSFFLYQVPFAIGQGRGERCESIPVDSCLAHVLVTPSARVSTKDVYDGLRQSRQFGLTAPHASISMLVHALSNGSLVELAPGLWNDLEPEAIRRCPVSGLIQSRLRESQCLGALVSGSGPTVFGLCRDVAHAHAVAAALRVHAEPSWRINVVQTLDLRGAKVLNPA